MVSLQAITGKEVRVRLLVFGYQVCVLVLGYKVGILGWTVYVEIVCFRNRGELWPMWLQEANKCAAASTSSALVN